MQLAFVIMSAVHSSVAVEQLARALSPHLVLIHHDFSQTPNFSIDAPNACFVPDAKRTGWACWGFSEGIFHALNHALERHSFDYLQLLSPTCLPIKPVAAFESYIASSGCEANFDFLDVASNRDVLMSVGYRAFTPERSLRHRILRRLSGAYFGGERNNRTVQIAGVQVRSGAALTRSGAPTPIANLALRVLQAVRSPRIGRHPFDAGFPASFGSIWFGARRSVVERMVESFSNPSLQRYFCGLRIADEFLIPTLLRSTGARQGPTNHLVSTFENANPSWFQDSDFARLQDSHAYFARKFRDDPHDPVRRRVLAELATSNARLASRRVAAMPVDVI